MRAGAAGAPGSSCCSTCRMPDVDGFDGRRAAARRPGRPASVPIVVLTHKEMTRADRDRLAGQHQPSGARRGRSTAAGSSSSSDGWVAQASEQEADVTPRGPGRRGQPAEPEAGARRARVRRLRDARGDHAARTASGSRRDDRPDLVLMDLQLPGIDGVEALRDCAPIRRPRADPGRGRHRLRDEGRPRARFAAAGFDGYVEKPISVRELPRAGRATSSTGRRAHDDAAPRRILVVDDQPQNVRLLEAMLAPRGYDVGRRGVRRGGARARSPRATSTWCCSTS